MTDLYSKEGGLREKIQRLAMESEKAPLIMKDALHLIAEGGHGYGIPLLLLSLPGALPMPALGMSSMLGVVVTLLGLQMFIGKRSVWLPRWFNLIRVRSSWCKKASRMGERFLPWVERLVKPRMNWMRYRLGTSLLGMVVIILGLLMMIPISGTNTLPAIILLVLSFGLIETDGLLTLLAALAGLLVAVLYADIIYLLIVWLTT